MRKLVSSFVGVLAIAASGCSAHEGFEEPYVDSAQQEINRGDLGGPDQVMALLITMMVDFGNGPEPALNICSGTLYAEKTLVTAAHCFDGGEILDITAYWGDNVLVEANMETFIPVIAWEQHPDWNPETLEADIATATLLSDPPFEPMALGIAPVPRGHVGKEVTIVGYGYNPSGAATEEWGGSPMIKRTGKTKYLGDPDVHPLPTEPHPSLSDRRIRKALMELESEAPKAAACFGDSGGPAIMKVGKHEVIVGISHYGDSACEEYSYYTRVKPYLSFLSPGEDDDGCKGKGKHKHHHHDRHHHHGHGHDHGHKGKGKKKH